MTLILFHWLVHMITFLEKNFKTSSVDATSLEVVKARLNGALGSLTYCMDTANGWGLEQGDL